MGSMPLIGDQKAQLELDVKKLASSGVSSVKVKSDVVQAPFQIARYDGTVSCQCSPWRLRLLSVSNVG